MHLIISEQRPSTQNVQYIQWLKNSDVSLSFNTMTGLETKRNICLLTSHGCHITDPPLNSCDILQTALAMQRPAPFLIVVTATSGSHSLLTPNPYPVSRYQRLLCDPGSILFSSASSQSLCINYGNVTFLSSGSCWTNSLMPNMLPPLPFRSNLFRKLMTHKLFRVPVTPKSDWLSWLQMALWWVLPAC